MKGFHKKIRTNFTALLKLHTSNLNEWLYIASYSREVKPFSYFLGCICKSLTSLPTAILYTPKYILLVQFRNVNISAETSKRKSEGFGSCDDYPEKQISAKNGQYPHNLISSADHAHKCNCKVRSPLVKNFLHSNPETVNFG